MKRKRDTHALTRTSPKGPGQEFIGYCFKCGAKNLTIADMGKPCINPLNLTDDEALKHAIGMDQ